MEDGSLLPLEPHRRREDALVARVRVRALKTAEAILTVSADGRSNVALLKGIPEPPISPPEPAPDSLQFEKPSYRVAIGKRKAIELRAPAGLDRQRVRVASDQESVVVKGGGSTTLSVDETLGFCVGTIRIEGRGLGARATLRATLDDQYADCQVSVVDRDDGLPDLKIKLDHDDPADYRSWFDPPTPAPDGSWTLWIMVRHPSLAPLVGEDLAGEHSPEFRAVLAEVVTEALVRKVLTKKYPPSQEVDAERLYSEHGQWLTKLLPKVQRVVLQ